MTDRPGIAIIGLSCRFPGASDHHAYWRNLCEGVESVVSLTERDLASASVPTQLVDHPSYVRAAAPLPNIDGFDAAFFGYSPYEARLIDPQQRLLLELAWSAFEDAGYRPGGRVGVFVGLGGVVSSYLVDRLPFARDLPGSTGSPSHLGNDKDFASTRISYKLGLTGPSINIQTACSTSLVAVHLACQSILDGECDMALAGASTVRVPQLAGYLSVKGGILSSDGHCRPFDARADGTIFGSGVGVVLLKELERAVADRDHIYAVIGGSAVNNDGDRKVSYTASSVGGQAQALVEAMTVAQVRPDDIQYVECHGTGTIVGDPLEISALTRSFRTDTERRGFCAVGSVKGNLGHLEQAAGMAGLIKTALALKHRRIPASINFHEPNPKIDFTDSPFFVNTECRHWPNGNGRRAAIVNSLGLGGTNACVVLEGADADETPERDESDLRLFVVSAKSPAALKQSLAAHRTFLASNPALSLGSLCFTSTNGRVAMPHRACAVASSVAQLHERLGHADANGRPGASERKLAFLFSGQASQYAGMSAEIYRREPVFRDVIDRCSEFLRDRRDRSLLDILFAEGHGLDATGYTQPALYAVQSALVELWRAWGIAPDFVIGHSVGEFTAAYCAGVYTLEEGLVLISERARLMQQMPEGAMAAIFADEHAVAEAVGDRGDPRLAVAASNSPQNTVISGPTDSVEDISTLFERRGVGVHRLKVTRAFHSPMMDPAVSAFRSISDGISARPPRIQWISTVTGAAVHAAPGADYWSDHARKGVRFLDAMRALPGDATHFVEIGPGSSLLTLGRTCLPDNGQGWLSSLQRGKEHEALLSSVGELYRGGYEIDWDQLNKRNGGGRASLPTYPFEHQRFWLDGDRDPATTAMPSLESRLTGTRVASAQSGSQFDAVYGLGRFPFLDDHRIHGAPILPLTAALCALQRAGQQHFNSEQIAIANLQYRSAMVLPDEDDVSVRLAVQAVDSTNADVSLASSHGCSGWTTHLAGSVRHELTNGAEPYEGIDLDAVRQRCGFEIAADVYYSALHKIGLQYGVSFRGIQTLHRGAGEIFAHVRLPSALAGASGGHHPALLDACLHAYPALVEEYGNLPNELPTDGGTFLPIGIERFRSTGPPAHDVWVHAVHTGRANDDTLTADIRVYARNGRLVASMEGLTLKRLSPDDLIAQRADAPLNWLYQMRWHEVPSPALPAERSTAGGRWLVLADQAGVGEALCQSLTSAGLECRSVRPSDLDEGGQFRASIDNLAARFSERVSPDREPLAGIVNLWALDVPTECRKLSQLSTAQRYVIKSAAALFRAFAHASDGHPAPRIWHVTSGAVSATSNDRLSTSASATLWGVGRSAALEFPNMWGGLIDLDTPTESTVSEQALRIFSELFGKDREDQIAIRGDRRFAARLVRMAAPVGRARHFDPTAAYLVTGGFGSVGLTLAKWLVVRGVKQVIFASRQGRTDPRAQATEQSFRELGAEITVLTADLSTENDVRSLLDQIAERKLTLKGVFHCAGVLDDGILAQMDWEQFERVLAPKVNGAWLLDRLTRTLPLDHFVLFSSVLSLIGSAGQANYCAANAFLDTLSARRRSEGLPSLVLNWGPWAAEGLATASGEKGKALWRARGTRYLDSEVVWKTMDSLLESDAGQAAITLTDWPTFFQQFSAVPALYRELDSTRGAADSDQHGSARDSIRIQLDNVPASERRTLLTEVVANEAKRTLGLSEPIDPSRPLREYGLDSLMSVMLINRLENAFGARVPMVKLIQGPAVEQIVELVLQQIGSEAPRHANPDTASPSKTAGSRWLVPLRHRPAASFRLFCFPFAGGGSAAFRTWVDVIAPFIEVVAVEPPGRLGRIDEKPVDDIDEFVGGLVPELERMLDRPYAFFGHCLGGLTLYETALRLVHSKTRPPSHLFVSGARPPDRIDDRGAFEQRLTEALVDFAEFRLDLPLHRQADDIFTQALRHFRILATEQLLADPELRALMLPAVRAEFRMAGNYQFSPEAPLQIPITCFFAHDDPYITREHALGWGRFTDARFQLLTRSGAHFAVADDLEFLAGTINRELQGADDRSSDLPGTCDTGRERRDHYPKVQTESALM